DAWWEIAEGEKDKLTVENIKLRAGSLYELGVEDLVPLDKKRVSSRLREIARLRKGSGSAKESYLAGLVVALSFDPGTVTGEDELKTCRDLSGRGNDGTFSGGKAVRGKVGGGLGLNGSGERVVIVHKEELVLEQGSTVSMWFKPGSSLGRGLEKAQVLFSKGYIDRDLAYCLLFSDEGGGTMTGAFSERQYLSSNQNSWAAGKWAHVTMTLSLEGDDFVARLYINGALNDTNELRKDPQGSLGSISVGAMDPSGRSSFKGVVDEVAIWDRPLAAAEVTALYQDSSRGKSYCAAAPR
ncbi:MAG: LamG domain-containing protein, partial [Planctomycetota bacterium]|nr:LamG domain-containing protein [Planctomycetota bacterium]